jgi:hypothetical protein
VVTAVAGTVLTINLDGDPIAGVHCCRSYSAATPLVGDVVLVAVLRGATSVEYIAIDKIVP